MNILDRAAMFIRGFGRNVKVIATMAPTWGIGQPSYPETKFATLVKEGWRKNELIYACVDKVSSTAAQVKMKVYDNATGKALANHPLALILNNPNPFMGEFEFWSSVIIYQAFAGRAIYEKERTRGGEVIRLWPLRPDWIAPIPSAKNMISGYQYTVPGMPPVRLPVEDVVDFKLFDPLNQYQGWPPVAVASRVGTVDNSATDYAKLFFEKGGAPPGYIKTVQKLRDAEVEEIRRKWRQRYGGIEGWIEPAVLDRDADYKQIGQSFKDMGFDILDARNEARICAILKVPPIIVGAKVGLDRSTFSNYREARSSWWEDTLVPIYVSFLDVLAYQLGNEFPGVFLNWDLSAVPALREERLVLWQRANEGLRMGGITVNEYRQELGLDSIGRRGDVFLRPLNVTEVSLRGPQVQPTPSGQPAEDVEEEDKPAEGEGKAARTAPDYPARKKLEKKVHDAMSNYFAAQEKDVMRMSRHG